MPLLRTHTRFLSFVFFKSQWEKFKLYYTKFSQWTTGFQIPWENLKLKFCLKWNTLIFRFKSQWENPERPKTSGQNGTKRFQIPVGRFIAEILCIKYRKQSKCFKSQREELELISVFIAFIHNLSFKSQRGELEHDIQVKYFNSIAKFQIPTEKVKTLTPKIYTLLGLHVSNPKGKSQNAVVLAIAFGRNVGFKSQWEKC